MPTRVGRDRARSLLGALSRNIVEESYPGSTDVEPLQTLAQVLANPAANAEAISKRECCTAQQVNMTIRLPGNSGFKASETI
ncbi:MAG: hypothetical protein QOH14_3891 [Pseudonocardiales bacterium]|jgi:hypothetical protein|nr:hypothetical protein [Pseudonocardiales bacterium]